MDHSGSFLDDVPIHMFMIFLIFPAMNLHLRNSKLENLTNQRQKRRASKGALSSSAKWAGRFASCAPGSIPALVGASSPSEKYDSQ